MLPDDTTTSTGSFWLAGVPAPVHPPATDAAPAEVAVVGAGIAGVTTALLLARAGVDVVLLEARRVGSGVSGATTGKVSSAHGSCYASLTSRIGADVARAYGTANEQALDWMRRTVAQDAVECDWRDRDAYTYTVDPERVEDVAAEARASAASGLPARLVADVPLPFDTAAAVHVTGQADVHAGRYVLGLARLCAEAGVRIHENTRVTGVSAGSPCVVRTEVGDVRADRVVLATHVPILDRGLFFARLGVERSYCVAARATGEVPQDMFFSVDQPSRSLRTAPLDNGGTLLIAGGEGHETGKDDDPGRRYRALWEWMREHFPVEARTAYRWSAQDATAVDGLPYAGPLHPGGDRIHVITGLRKWGFTNGTACARVVADLLLDRDDPTDGLFSPSRLHVRASVGALVKENASVAGRFVRDRVANRGNGGAETLARGEGAVVRLDDGTRAAAYRDGDGVLHAVSPTCTHLGCEVRFNGAERSWDCPCHASRFSVDGDVLEGPAVHPLQVVEVPARDRAVPASPTDAPA